MTAEQWKNGRKSVGLTQVEAARSLGITQPYLSQLEKGKRVAGAELVQKALSLYKLSPVALPLPDRVDAESVSVEDLQRKLASLGYPGFEHAYEAPESNPAEVVLSVVMKQDLDTRLVEALPWVLATYSNAGFNWDWLRDHAKLKNLQNKLGYLVYLSTQVASRLKGPDAAKMLSAWEEELEQARLAKEGTLGRDSMREPERAWLRNNRPEAANHWGLLTSLTADQLPYVTT